MLKYLRITVFLSLSLVTCLYLISCKEDDPGPGVTVNANAGTDQTIEIGDEVSLDGSASSSSDGSALTYSWGFTSVPQGSTVTITNSSQAQASFTPDAQGAYVIQLTVTSGSATGTDEVTITVNPPSGPDDISGTISENTVLENVFEDPELADYTATAAVNVQAELTVMPGVKITFAEDVMLTVASGGALIAEGEASDSVVFTSTDVAGGILWKGVYIASSSAQNSFELARVSYAGNSKMNFSGEDFEAGIGVESGGKVNVTSSLIRDNKGYGLYIEESGGELADFSGNAFAKNDISVGLPADQVGSLDVNTTFSPTSEAVEIFGSTFTQTNVGVWPALNASSTYHVSGNLVIDGELTISPGASFEMDEDVLITVTGAFIANGATDNRITFTTSDDANSLRWKGFYFTSADGRNSLDFADISYAGNSVINFSGVDFKAAIGVENSAKVSVTNCNVTDNDGYGLYIEDSGGQLEVFSANHFENNVQGVGLPADEVDAIDGATSFASNTQAAVEIFGSIYAQTNTSTWQQLDGDAAYRVTNDISILGELTIAPGTVMEFDEDVLVSVAGALIADGSMTEMITLTSSNVSGGLKWKGIYVASASSLNKFNYVTLSHAANSVMNFAGEDFKAGIGVESTGKVSVTNSTFSDNTGYGLYVEETSGQIELFSDNTFEDNLQGVGCPADEVDAIDGNTVFMNNTQADVEIFGSDLDMTKTVTWNDLNGDASYRVTGHLGIEGTLTVAPGAVFEIDEDLQIAVNGALIAAGTSAEMITFTSSNVAGGLLWKGIYVLSSNSQNLIDYCEVSYGGNSTHNFSGTDHKANIGVNTGAQMTVTNSLISNGGGAGIYSKGTMNLFSDIAAGNTFTNNALPNTQE